MPWWLPITEWAAEAFFGYKWQKQSPAMSHRLSALCEMFRFEREKKESLPNRKLLTSLALVAFIMCFMVVWLKEINHAKSITKARSKTKPPKKKGNQTKKNSSSETKIPRPQISQKIVNTRQQTKRKKRKRKEQISFGLLIISTADIFATTKRQRRGKR